MLTNTGSGRYSLQNRNGDISYALMGNECGSVPINPYEVCFQGREK